MNMRSVVLGSAVPEKLHITVSKREGLQSFARDEVLLDPAADPYSEIARASKIVAEGRSLALDFMMRGLLKEH